MKKFPLSVNSHLGYLFRRSLPAPQEHQAKSDDDGDGHDQPAAENQVFGLITTIIFFDVLDDPHDTNAQQGQGGDKADHGVPPLAELNGSGLIEISPDFFGAVDPAHQQAFNDADDNQVKVVGKVIDYVQPVQTGLGYKDQPSQKTGNAN